MSDTFDRDAARKLLEAYNRFTPGSRIEKTLDALEACVRPALPQIIDREALLNVLSKSGLDTWSAAGAMSNVLALLRPVDGVVLTREEAGVAARALRTGLGTRTPAEVYRARVDLAARLEAAS